MKSWRLQFEDLIRFRHFKPSEEDTEYGRLEPISWTAQIINWWQVAGFGETKEEAFADLKAKLKSIKDEGTFQTGFGPELSGLLDIGSIQSLGFSRRRIERSLKPEGLGVLSSRYF